MGHFLQNFLKNNTKLKILTKYSNKLIIIIIKNIRIVEIDLLSK